MNKSEIYTDEIKEGLNHSTLPDLQRISNLLHSSGLTPYIYIRQGLQCLVHGNIRDARREIDFAMKFRGIFFKPGSPEDKEYCIEMQLVNAAFLFLAEKFRKLPQNTETAGIKGEREYQTPGREEMKIISSMMKYMNITPYLYIGIAMELFASGFTDRAYVVLAYAKSFNGIFYHEGSARDNDYRESVELLMHIIREFPVEFSHILNKEK